MSQINIGGTTLSFKDSSFTGDQWESVASWVLNGGAETTEVYAKEAKSYAVGGTGLRTDEDTDNAKYYKEQSAAAATKAETASNHPRALEATATGKCGILTLRNMYKQNTRQKAACQPFLAFIQPSVRLRQHIRKELPVARGLLAAHLITLSTNGTLTNPHG